MADRDSAIFTLHRYFIWAIRMHEHLCRTLAAQGPMPDYTPDTPQAERESIEAAARIWFLPVFLYSSLWHALLYVVVEGWQKLELHDPLVDSLLTPSFVSDLRRYRNAAFHYEPKYLDQRIQTFAAEWKEGQTLKLHDALSVFFFRWLRDRGSPVPDHLIPPQ